MVGPTGVPPVDPDRHALAPRPDFPVLARGTASPERDGIENLTKWSTLF